VRSSSRDSNRSTRPEPASSANATQFRSAEELEHTIAELAQPEGEGADVRLAAADLPGRDLDGRDREDVDPGIAAAPVEDGEEVVHHPDPVGRAVGHDAARHVGPVLIPGAAGDEEPAAREDVGLDDVEVPARVVGEDDELAVDGRVGLVPGPGGHERDRPDGLRPRDGGRADPGERDQRADLP
jgi:hypothetical protein